VKRLYRQQHAGFSIVAALFLIVVLAALGAFAVRVGAAGEHEASLDLMQSRALAAARSGIEFGVHQALVAAPSSCADVTFALTQSALAGFTVDVRCRSAAQDVGVPPAATTYQTFQIDATARYGLYGTPGYVSRHLTRTVSNAPLP
jgi:MSHA biogenesis protein MshP